MGKDDQPSKVVDESKVDTQVTFTLINFGKMQNADLAKAWENKDCSDTKPLDMKIAGQDADVSLAKFHLIDSRYPGPDWTAEPILQAMMVPQQPKTDDKNAIATLALEALPPSKNKYQVSYNEGGTPRFGAIQGLCNRPWLFHDDEKDPKAGVLGFFEKYIPLKDLFDHQQAKLDGPYVKEMCKQIKRLAQQKPLFTTGRLRLPFRDYSELRTNGIQQFDIEPCADPEERNWPVNRLSTTNLFPAEEQALSTQQCFTCIKTRTGQFKEENDPQMWRCPVVGRRKGLVVGASAQHFDSRRTCPHGRHSDKDITYSESVCACLVCGGGRAGTDVGVSGGAGAVASGAPLPSYIYTYHTQPTGLL